MADVIGDVTKVVNLRNAIGQGLWSAAYRAGSDFIAGNNKPWYYYTGVLAGASAAATGIDGASATIFVLAEALSAQVEKGPGRGELVVYLDGVQQGVIDLEASSAIWELVEIFVDPLSAAIKRVDLVQNVGLASVSWFAMSNLIASHDTLTPQFQDKEDINMAFDTLVFRMKDIETDSNLDSVPVRVPTGLTLAQIQAYANYFAPLLDDASGAYITEISVTLGLTLPAGIKTAAVAGSLNERGGLIPFTTSGPSRDSFRIPAILFSVMPGDAFSVADAAIAPLVAALTSEQTAANVQPRTAADYEFLVAAGGKKSLRRK